VLIAQTPTLKEAETMLEVGQRCELCKHDESVDCLEDRRYIGELRKADAEAAGRAGRHGRRLHLETYARCPLFERKRYGKGGTLSDC
jgi:hypothetical protein